MPASVAFDGRIALNDLVADDWRDVTVDLAQAFDWVAPVVIARLVRRSAVTLAVTTGTVPTAAAVRAEAWERLLRATAAVLGAVAATGQHSAEKFPQAGVSRTPRQANWPLSAEPSAT